MIELRALGAIEFLGLDEAGAEALRSHPRCVAVLAYLTLVASGGAERRADLVSVFWPNADRARGRGSLRAALHFLRKHLGAAAIRSRGDELAIDPALVACDALTFEALISQDRHAEALDVYAGDLLPGIRVRGAPRFADWVEEKRAGLRQSAAEARWALSADAERFGRWIEAADHARRAVGLSNDLEPSLRRLMRLLVRAGDRVAALREYEAFTVRWQSQHRATPSAETRALAETIRGGPSSAAALPLDTQHVTKRGTQGDTPRVDRWPHRGKIAVLPFRLAGERREHAYVATGLAHDVIASLSRVSGIVMVARRSPDPARGHVMRHEDRSSAAIGREMDAEVILDGSVRVLDDQVIVVARLLDARTEASFWADAYDCPRAELGSVRARLITDVLAALGRELSTEEEARLMREPTTSPAAYELYLEGQHLLGLRTQPGTDRSIRLFERALEIDPKFAVALASLADACAVLHPAAGRRLDETRIRAREAARAALSLDPLLGEPYATLGLLRAFADQDWAGAERDLRRAIELSPGHASAHHWLGALLTYVRREFDEGARELGIARELDPYSPVIQAEVGMALVNRGEIEAGQRMFAEIIEIHPTFWRAHYFLGIASYLMGDPDHGIEHLERAWRLGAFGAGTDRRASPDIPAGADWRERLRQRLVELESSVLQPGVRSVEAALICMLLVRRDEALHWLRAVGEASSWAWITEYLPVFQPLRNDPEFVGLLDDAGLGSVLDTT